jgi:uncharacterized membrane protein
MTIALVILGLVVGGYSDGIPGALVGAGLGYAIASLISLKNRLQYLEREVSELRLLRPEMRQVSPMTPETSETEGLASVPPPEEPAEYPTPEETFTFQEIKDDAGEDATTVPLRQSRSYTRHPQAPEQAQPALATSFTDMLNRYITGGSLMAKIGIVILFFGISFLIKYAAEHELLPIQLRLVAAAAAGIALLGIGWQLRRSRDIYAQALQGGGVGILYLTTFAALRMYSIIPPTLAFPVLVAVAVLSAALAIAQNACSLAVIGISGGFLAPILTSTGGGSHVILFSYYTLLNCGIVMIAWFRAWRILNLLGFAFTFVIGAMWGYRYYRPEYFATTEPFLILFFIIYTAIAILFALRREPDLKGYLDGTLVFGTPVVAFALQGMLVESYPYGLAWSALALGLLYLLVSWILFRKKIPYMRTLAEAFLAFGVIFATLAIPLSLDNRWTSAAWALEGAGILWAGLRQERILTRVFGVLLLFGAGMSFLVDAGLPTKGIPVLNGWFLGCVLLAVSAIFSALCLYRHRNAVGRWEILTGTTLFVWGLLWWFGGGLNEIDRQFPIDYRMGSIIVFLTASCMACDYLERRLSWAWASWPALLLLPLLFLASLACLDGRMHPLSQWGFIAWPFAVAAFYRILRRHERAHAGVLKFLHAGTLWLVTWLLVLEIRWQMDYMIAGADIWPQIAWGIAPSVVLFIVSIFGRKLKWPVQEHLETYIYVGCAPVALSAWLWTMYINFTSPGDSHPLKYVPLLNPLDITICVVYAALTVWHAALRAAFPHTISDYQRKVLLGSFTAGLFIWVNAVLVRTIHQWGGIEFAPSPLFRSMLLQATFSIFWSLLALCTMVIATRRGLRQSWLAGAGLLAAVVVKLFLVDLSNTGTVERIVSFVGVGILLLIIGYASPVPPRDNSYSDRIRGGRQ